MIQGLGRIDRIDSPHSRIHYCTFDLPGLVLSSDHKARDRVKSIALLSGVGAKDLPSELVEFSAGDVTGMIVDQIKRPRALRPNNKFDMITSLKRRLDPVVLERVQMGRPKGLWGAELCLLQGHEPMTLLVITAENGGLRDSAALPPRLIAIREEALGLQVIGEQTEAAGLLDATYATTVAAGRHQHRPTLREVQNTLGHLSEALGDLSYWDIRPARTVSLLASLAAFLYPETADDEGHRLFGELTLPCLEKLAEVWASHLDPAWITAKQTISSRSKTGREIPDYLGIDAIMHCFLDGPL